MSSRKKGWKTVREMVGERPRPTSPDKQNALAFHSVMESGTFTASSLTPDRLVWRRRTGKIKTKNNQNVVTQKSSAVNMGLDLGT